MSQSKVSLPVINRLPRYYRYIDRLYREGVTTISSSELASLMGTTASQVRQDFNCFGGFGQQGIGYTVEVLRGELSNLLLGGAELTAVLVGTGRLGRAISQFLAREAPGYHFTAAFDRDPAQTGLPLAGLTVQHVDGLESWCKANGPDVAVLCLPEEGAAEVVDLLLGAGVRGFWNFSHYDIAAAKGTSAVIENVHLSDSLMSLGYRVRHREDDK